MTEGAGRRRCPICSRPSEARYKPFCSARCANVDLSRWLNEGYRIPARPDSDEEESASEGNAPRGAGSGAQAPAISGQPSRAQTKLTPWLDFAKAISYNPAP